MSRTDLVDAQVAAYNARDVEAFAACYAEDVLIEDAERGVLARGRAQVREQYGPFFAAAPTCMPRSRRVSVSGRT